MSSGSHWSVRSHGRTLCQALSLSLASLAVHAQTAPAAPAEAKPALSDVERAKRDADKVFQWIKFHAEKGEKKPEKPEAKAETPRPAAKPAAAPAPVVARRQEPEPVSERAPAARSPAQEPVAMAAPAPVTQTIAPPASSPSPLSETPAPQGMSMSAPVTAAAAGKAAPPEPAPLEPEDVPLKLVRKVDPEYPRSLLAQQRQGSVLVQFTVRPDGSVDAAQATRSPDRKLSTAAVNAVRQWRFEPIPAPRQVSVEIGFQVE